MSTTSQNSATLSRSKTGSAPYADKIIQMGARTKVSLAAAGHPLALYQPKTKLGGVALDLAVAATSSYLTVMATAGYVYAVTQLQLPNPTFGEPPSGVNINPADLQAAWSTFNTDFAIIQGQLDTFMDTTPGTANPASILSQLVSVPKLISGISGTVVLDFASKNASDLENLFGALNTQVKSLNTSLTTLGTNIENATITLDTAATTGVLEQLYQAYESDISGLQQAIENAQDTIDSDNAKIIGEGVGAGVSVTVGLIGLANFWNPIGWIMMAGGAIGAYFAIEEIEALKAQIAGLKNTIETDTQWENTYGQSATAIQATMGSINGFSSMQAAAELELAALENVLSTLSGDIVDAISDLEQSTPDWADAQTEWDEILATAGALANITAYVWPNPTELSNPTGLSSTNNGLYQISSAGLAYYLPAGGTAWAQLTNYSLSVVTGGSATGAVAIDGSPAVGAAGVDPNYPTNYYVKTYDLPSNTWTVISNFAAAQVATDGTNIFAINQLITSRAVCKYNGAGTDWTNLPALPNTDAASSIAIAGSTVFAMSINSQQIYYYANSQWTLISNSLKFIGMSGNGNYLSAVDTNNNSYLWNASTNQFENSGSPTATQVLNIGQLSNGNQIIINASQNLCSVNNSASPVVTQLATDVVGFTAVGGIYRFDADGSGYCLTDEANNTWTLLPVIS